MGHDLADDLEHLVTHLVPVAVVELLEVVDVGHDQGEGFSQCLCFLDCLAKANIEGTAIGNLGEAVGQTLFPDILQVIAKIGNLLCRAVDRLGQLVVALRHVPDFFRERGDQAPHDVLALIFFQIAADAGQPFAMLLAVTSGFTKAGEDLSDGSCNPMARNQYLIPRFVHIEVLAVEPQAEFL